MFATGNRQAYELLLIEEADAWFEYADATKGQAGGRYAEIEPWAWARLQQRLRAVRARRARLEPATDRSRLFVEGRGLDAPANLGAGHAKAFHIQLRRAPAQGEAARTPNAFMKEIPFATFLVPTPEGGGGTGAVRGRRSDCRT